jgi:phage-related holin
VVVENLFDFLVPSAYLCFSLDRSFVFGAFTSALLLKVCYIVQAIISDIITRIKCNSFDRSRILAYEDLNEVIDSTIDCLAAFWISAHFY